jgi:hypothetical protein
MPDHKRQTVDELAAGLAEADTPGWLCPINATMADILGLAVGPNQNVVTA